MVFIALLKGAKMRFLEVQIHRPRVYIQQSNNNNSRNDDYNNIIMLIISAMGVKFIITFIV